MLVFIENIGQKYDFEGGGVVSCLSSLPPNCQKITWGHHGGVRYPPCFLTKLSKNNMGASQGTSNALQNGGVQCPLDTPMLFFDNLVKKLDKLSL